MSLFLLRKSRKTDPMSEMPNISQKKADLLMSLFVTTRFSRTGVKRYMLVKAYGGLLLTFSKRA